MFSGPICSPRRLRERERGGGRRVRRGGEGQEGREGREAGGCQCGHGRDAHWGNLVHKVRGDTEAIFDLKSVGQMIDVVGVVPLLRWHFSYSYFVTVLCVHKYG